MGRITQPNGKDNTASHPVVQQLRKDVDHLKPALADVQQKATWLVQQSEKHERLLADVIVRQDRIETYLKRIIAQNDIIIAARSEP